MDEMVKSSELVFDHVTFVGLNSVDPEPCRVPYCYATSTIRYE
jgi:hypothetical protein